MRADRQRFASNPVHEHHPAMIHAFDGPARGLARLFLACLISVVLLPRPAHAQRAEVSTEADVEQCISSRLLRERVRRAATGPIDDELVLRVSIARVGEEYRMHVEIRGPSGAPLGDRELVTPALRCQDLDDAIVLVSVLMLDSASLQQQMHAARRGRLPWSVGASAGARFRSLPSPSPDVGLTLQWTRARVSVNARVFLGGETSVAVAEGRFGLRALGVDARACYALGRFGPLSLGPCAAATVGQLRGQTTGLLEQNESVRNAHVRAGLGLEARVDAGRFIQLVPALVVDLAVTRTAYRFTQFAGAQEAFRVPLVGVRAELAVLVRIGGAP
jgi:hypothetical protein